MKKIHLLLSTGIAMSAFMINSCQQPAADPAAIDAKVTEAYQAQKTAVENEMAAACDNEINTKVQAFKDSLATMSAKDQAALMAKKNAALAAAQKKATADAKKKAVAKKPITPAKPVNQTDKQLDDRFSGKSNAEQTKAIDQKLDDRFSKPVEQQTLEQKKAVDKKLDDRFK